MIPKYRLFTGQEVRYAHVKRDGILILVYKNRLGSVQLLTKRPTDLTGKLKYLPSLKNVWTRVPCGTQLAGELWYPGKPASYVKTALKEQDTTLRFEAFCVGGNDDVGLEEVRMSCSLWGLSFVPYYLVDEHTPCDLMERCHNGTIDDCEGFMFKNGNLLDWYKWKVTKTVDLVVRGTQDGRGKYLGLVGALRCYTVEGHYVANCSGMSDAERIYMSDEEEDLPGRVVEVKYDYVGSRGRLRFPRFVQWREDKAPEQCTVDQDHDLQQYWENVP